MSPIVILLAAVFFLRLFSQFGATLPARDAPLWWLVAALLFLSAVKPTSFLFLTHLLGVQLVSNFVLISLTLFLFFQMAAQQSENARKGRQLVELVSSLAAATYLPSASEKTPTSLVVFPCYNEQGALPDLIRRIRGVEQSASAAGIAFCIVNDGSTDATEAVMRGLRWDQFVTHPCNLGVAGALLTGFKIARSLGARTVLQCDADGQHPVEDIPRMIAHRAQCAADVLVGTRFSMPGSDSLRSTTLFRRLGGQLVRATLLLFGRQAWVTDPTSGFRAYSPQAIEVLMRRMPDEYPEPESIALIALAGLRIGETPVLMEPRQHGHSSLAGIKSLRFMTKVAAALVGLRLRSIGS